MLLGTGAARDEVTSAIAEVAFGMAPEQGDAQAHAAARELMGWLLNEDQGSNREFSEFHLVLTKQGWKEGDEGFRLMEERQRGDSLFVVATSTGINVLLGSLDIDIEDRQKANELLIKQAIDSGKYGNARKAAIDARYLSAQYEAELHDVIQVARLDLGKVDWSGTEEARSILGAVESELGQARLEANSLHDAATTAERKAREAAGQRELLEGHQATLSALGVELEEVPTEFDRIAPEDARTAVGDFRQHYSAARRQEGEARQRVEEQAERIRQFSVRPEFNEVTGKLLVLRQLSHDELADEMERQEHDYRARLGELQREIDAFEEDKQLVVGELLEATEGAFDYLGDIARRPLPPNLGDWSGKPFAKIHLERIDRDDLSMRLTHLIEQEIDRKTTRVQVDEMDLLKKAVRAANRNRPFDVKLLKPNTALALERRPASEAQKWSEGERLTAAILVYCILLGLRSKGGAAEWDTLILDNPFGKANHISRAPLAPGRVWASICAGITPSENPA